MNIEILRILLWVTPILLIIGMVFFSIRTRLHSNSIETNQKDMYDYKQFVPLIESFAELSEIEKFQLSSMLTDIISEPKLQKNKKIRSLQQFILTAIKSKPPKNDKRKKSVKATPTHSSQEPKVESIEVETILVKDFNTRLLEIHPDLSEKDVLLCNYIIENKSIREISEIKGISLGSIRVYKTKLKSKLNLPSEAVLSSYLKSI